MRIGIGSTSVTYNQMSLQFPPLFSKVTVFWMWSVHLTDVYSHSPGWLVVYLGSVKTLLIVLSKYGFEVCLHNSIHQVQLCFYKHCLCMVAQLYCAQLHVWHDCPLLYREWVTMCCTCKSLTAHVHHSAGYTPVGVTGIVAELYDGVADGLCSAGFQLVLEVLEGLFSIGVSYLLAISDICQGKIIVLHGHCMDINYSYLFLEMFSQARIH